MTCRQELARKGLPSPRTCADCGLGPCRVSTPITPDTRMRMAVLHGLNAVMTFVLDPEAAVTRFVAAIEACGYEVSLRAPAVSIADMMAIRISDYNALIAARDALDALEANVTQLAEKL